MIRIDVYHHLDPAVNEVQSRLIKIDQKLDLIIGEFMTDLTELATNEERLIGVVDILLAASVQARADLAQAKIDLAAALAANDPAAAKAVQDQIDAIAKALGDEAAKVEGTSAPATPAPDATA